MYKTTLVEADIEDGERVVTALESSGLKVIAAFWSSSEEEDDWHLVIVSPDVAEKGPRHVYKQAFSPLHNLKTEPPRRADYWWDRIKILSPSSLIYRRLKERAGTGDSPVRPGWALDSYIYKLE
jgi:hypothetical protein